MRPQGGGGIFQFRKKRIVEITTSGATFAPFIEVPIGGRAKWRFSDGSTSTEMTPSKDFGSPGVRRHYLEANALRTFCVGYGADDGAGVGHMPTLIDGADLPSWDPQSVTSIAGLARMPGLVNVAVSNNPLASLDVSYTGIHFVEAFRCHSLTEIKLAGCQSLRRLCAENSPLATLDLSACNRIEDVRDRTADYVGGQNFYSSWPAPKWPGSLAYLWHFCFGDSPNITSIGATDFPALRDLWGWNSPNLGGDYILNAPLCRQVRFTGCSFTSFDVSACPLVDVIELDGNRLTEAAINALLITLAAGNVSDGKLEIRGPNMGTPSGDGVTAIATLLGRNWTVASNL